MARQRVGDLALGTGETQGALAPVTREDLDLKQWASRTPLSWRLLIAAGFGLVLGGLVAALVTITGFFGTAVISTMLTTGSGLVFLGLHKRRAVLAAEPAPMKALSASEQAVLRERSRRLRAVLRAPGAPFTFERVIEATRWTRDAVLSTLLYMQERGEVVEDLDLDTGEWVYLAQDPEAVPGTPPSLMLEERRALSGPTGTE